MSLYQMQKFLFDINRDRGMQAQFREQPDKVLDRYDLTREERDAIADGRHRAASTCLAPMASS